MGEQSLLLMTFRLSQHGPANCLAKSSKQSSPDIETRISDEAGTQIALHCVPYGYPSDAKDAIQKRNIQ